MINAVRISKTSAKQWELHGPIQEALKTTCQANQLKPFTLHLDDVHGEPVDLELWVDQGERESDQQEPNWMAQKILELQQINHVVTPEDLDKKPHQVKGVAVITGPGGSDVPGMERMSCVLMALAGQHDEKTE
jgi:hypothetical protein